jgi:hypothetical protein
MPNHWPSSEKRSRSTLDAGSFRAWSMSRSGRRELSSNKVTLPSSRPTARMAYDPRRPSLCRLASNVRRPSTVDLQLLLLGSIGMAMRAVVGAFRASVFTGDEAPAARRRFAALCWLLAALIGLFIVNQAWDFADHAL